MLTEFTPNIFINGLSSAESIYTKHRKFGGILRPFMALKAQAAVLLCVVSRHGAVCFRFHITESPLQFIRSLAVRLSLIFGIPPVAWIYPFCFLHAPKKA